MQKRQTNMVWSRLLNSQRLGGSSLTPAAMDVRNPFEADCDRITFSGAFRRMARKTQVHPLAINDHVHNRLTHSLEVAAVGRSLGRKLGRALWALRRPGIDPNSEYLMGSITAAACLAHDVGNPAFGHAGEHAMYHWCRNSGREYLRGLPEDLKHDLEVFEGNAQGFRMITQLENHLFSGGLRLTYATLGAFLKYPCVSRAISGKEKFGAYITEERILEKVAKEVGLLQIGKHRWCRHPLAYLMEAADDICYATIDLEDAVEMQIVDYAKVKNHLLRAVPGSLRRQLQRGTRSAESFRVNFTRIRGPVYARLIDKAIHSFLRNEQAIMAGKFEGDLFKCLPKKDPCRQVVLSGKSMAARYVFPYPRKLEIEIGCYSIIDTLLDAFCRAAQEQATFMYNCEEDFEISGKSRLVLTLLGNHAPRPHNGPNGGSWTLYECYRRMLDFVGGMTDNYATTIAEKLRGRC